MGSLRKLSLYSNFYWGFNPKLSLEGIHCPNLQSLTLGHFSFFEDQQVDWILSHSSTLQELYLDDCSILFRARIQDSKYKLDNCPIPTSRMEFQAGDVRGEASLYHRGDAWLYHYPRRWNDYFVSFETGLPHLRRFVIGHNGAWSPKTELAFEKELELVPALMHDRYMEFDGDTNPPFHSSRWHDTREENWPQCDKCDQAAAILRRVCCRRLLRGEFGRNSPLGMN